MLHIYNTTIALLLGELHIILKFISNDIWDTVIPCILTFGAAFIYHHKAWNSFPLSLLYSVLYTVLYILIFCIANQIISIEEDRLNKPYRPLVTGFVTVAGARSRNVIYNIPFIAVALWIGVFWFAVFWQIVTLLLCRWGFSDHCFLKNVFCITLGTIALLGAQWCIVYQLSPGVWNYILFVSLWAGLGLPLQDMRDQEGDKFMHRKTLPLDVGDIKAIILLIAHMLVLSPVIYFCAIITEADSFAEILNSKIILSISLVQILWYWSIAIRLWIYRTPKEDDNTYHWFVYLFCFTIPLICIL